MSDTTASRLIVDVQGKGIKSTAADMQKLDKTIVSTGKNTQKATSHLENTSAVSSKLGTIAKFAAGGIALTGAAFAAVGVSALKNASALEQNKIALTTMLKSASKANAVLKEFREFGAATPFETDEIIKAGKQMIAFGFSTEKTMDNLRMVGDIAAGIGAPLGELSEIYSKIKVGQVAYNEDLNILAGRGIPIFDELAKVTGRNASEIKKMSSEGKIGFAEIEKAFQNMTKEGGKFAGLMKAQSKSLGGLWSTFKSQLSEISTEIGKKMAPAFKELLTTLTESQVVLPAIKALFIGIASVVNGFVKAVNWAIQAIENLGKSLAATDRAAEIKNVQATIIHLKKMVAASGKATDIGKSYAAALKQQKVNLLELQIQQAKYNIELAKNKNKEIGKDLKLAASGVISYKKAIFESTKNNVSYYGSVSNLRKNLKKNQTSLLENGKALKQNDDIIKNSELELKKLIAAYNKLNNTKISAGPVAGFKKTDTAINKNKKNAKGLVDPYKGAFEWAKKLALAIDEVTKKNEGMVNALSKIMQPINDIGDSILDIFGSIADLMDANTQKQLAALDTMMQAELKAAGVAEQTAVEKAQEELKIAKEKGSESEIIEKESALKRAKIEEDYRKKKAQEEYKGALAAWQMNVAVAAAQAPLAILNAITAGWKYGPIGAAAFGVAAAAAAAINIAAVSAARPTPPTAQFGGDFIVPPGSPGDSGTLNVNQGEKVSVEKVADSGGASEGPMILQIGEDKFEAFLVKKMNSIANSGKFNITRKGIVRAI